MEKIKNQFEAAYFAVCSFYEQEKSYIYKTAKNPFRKLDNLETWFSKKVVDLNQQRVSGKLENLKFAKSLASLKIATNQTCVRGYNSSDELNQIDDSNIFGYINTKLTLDSCMSEQDQKILLSDTKITKQKKYKILAKARKLAKARNLCC